MSSVATSTGLPRIGLVTAWLSRNNGGVFEAVVAHAAMVRGAGFEPVVLGLADEHSDADKLRFGDTEVIAVPTAGPRMLGFAPGLGEALGAAELDLLHLHGIWTDSSRAASRWSRSTGGPYVISPHGMLDPWIVRRGRWKKALALAGYERRSWASASAFHALTGAEQADIERKTGRPGITAVIPNAVASNASPRTVGEQSFVFLGRIHPKKNVEGLVDAWLSAQRPAGVRLVIAGWGSEADVGSLTRKLEQAGDPSVEFVGPQFGEQKQSLLRKACFFCLPSHSEGLPMAILEAWAEGTPTLMSEHCHLDEGLAAGAAIDSGTEVRQIRSALEQALSLPDWQWLAMSGAALDLVRREFSENSVAERWKSLYDELLQTNGMKQRR